jgi:hypothetical protein
LKIAALVVIPTAFVRVTGPVCAPSVTVTFSDVAVGGWFSATVTSPVNLTSVAPSTVVPTTAGDGSHVAQREQSRCVCRSSLARGGR